MTVRFAFSAPNTGDEVNVARQTKRQQHNRAHARGTHFCATFDRSPSPAMRERAGVRASSSLTTLTFILSLQKRARKIKLWTADNRIIAPGDLRWAVGQDFCNPDETKCLSSSHS